MDNMKTSNKPSRKIMRLLPVILSLVLGALISQLASAADIAGIDKLMQTATQNGSVSVIVTLQQPAMPDRASKSPQDFDVILKGKVATAQAAVLDRLPANALVGKARRYNFTPQFAATVTPAGLTALANNPAVTAIQEDRLSLPFLEQSVPYIFPSNDAVPYTGMGWSVAVLDTGVEQTPSFLTGKVLSEACYSDGGGQASSTSVCPGGALSSTAVGSGVPCDSGIDGCDHGTHVAGISAGFLSNSRHGVAKSGGIIAIQVFSRFTSLCASFGKPSPCVLSYTSDQLGGLDRVYALRNINKIAAVNMSLGGGGPYNDSSVADCDGNIPLKLIIDQLKAARIATVISSGNNGFTTGIGAPACISSAIAVGATGHTDDIRAFFSNVGEPLDLYAPGVGISSSVPPNGFSTKSGTSMAAPHVAGAWAVMMGAKPTATVDEIETAFKNTGVAVTSAGVTRKRINIDQALAQIVSSHVLNVNISGSGTVTSSPASINCPGVCTETYLQNTVVTLTATPDSGWSFTGWGGVGGCFGSGTCVLTMTAAKGVLATFQIAANDLSVTKTGNGTVTSSPAGINCGIDCLETYAPGTTVTLTATPDSGWSFGGWGGACSGTGSCVVTMNSATAVSATFTQLVGGGGARFHPLSPCRLIDSRLTGGIAGGKIAAGTSKSYFVYGTNAEIQAQGGTGNCGVSQTAKAVVINITSTEAAANGHFRVYPSDEPLTSASIVNFNSGVTMANATVVPVCQVACVADIDIYSSTDSHLVVDTVGYIE